MTSRVGRVLVALPLVALTAAVAAADEDAPRASEPAPATTEAPPTASEPAPSIAGVVHAADGTTPLANAVVTLTNTTFAAVTDQTGAWAIADVPPGSYELRVGATGYEDAVVPIAVSATQPLALTTTLQKTVTGEEIVVTGSKYPEKRVEAPVTLERVTSADVERTGSSSYMTALSQVKGVQYRQSGLGDVRVSMRGFDSQFNTRMLFMEDGRLTEFPGNGVPLGPALPTPSLDIKGVEVIVGPASALYGANAVDGVINVLTKTPWDESGVSASMRVGNQNLGDVSLRVAGTVKRRLGYKLNFQWMQAQDFPPSRSLPFHYYGATATAPGIFEGDLVANHYQLRQAKVEGFLYGRLGHDWNLKAGSGYSFTDGISATNTGRNELRGFTVDYETVELSHPHWYAQVTRTGSSAGDSYQVDVLGTAVNAAGGLAMFDAQSLEALRQKLRFIDSSQMIDSELQYRTELWRQLRITTGAQFRAYFPSSNGTYLDDGNGKSIRRLVGGEYLQAEWQTLRKRLKLVGAVRVDEFSDYGTQVSPKGAVVLALAPEHFLRVGYNRAFRTPTILDAYLNIASVAAFGNHTGFVIKDASGNVVGNIPALQPEANDTLEIGYKGSIARRLFIDVVGFYGFYHNFIGPLTPVANPAAGTFASLPDGTPTFAGTPVQGALLTYANFGSAQVAGANGGIDWWLWRDRLLFTGSVSYIHLVAFAVGNAMQKQLPLNVPEVTARASLTLQDVGFRGMFVRFQGRLQEHYKFQSGFWDSTKPGWFANGELPTRFVADLVAGARLPGGVTLSGTLYNLFNDHGIDVLGAPPSGIVGFVQLAYAYAGLDY